MKSLRNFFTLQDSKRNSFICNPTCSEHRIVSTLNLRFPESERIELPLDSHPVNGFQDRSLATRPTFQLNPKNGEGFEPPITDLQSADLPLIEPSKTLLKKGRELVKTQNVRPNVSKNQGVVDEGKPKGAPTKHFQRTLNHSDRRDSDPRSADWKSAALTN